MNLQRVCVCVVALSALWAAEATAFCGFFVGPKEGLYNDATQVVMMRAGTDTVLSMRPDYSGPVENFAMVIPVPQVLQKKDVLTLTQRPFQTIDQLSAPRLVEYHEQDPCLHHKQRRYAKKKSRSKGGMGMLSESAAGPPAKPKVRVKAQFTRAEYQIVILDADESSALEEWLNKNGYKQPKGASKALAPYIQEGFYFFAAKVDVEKVKFEPGGRAVLSPLQFHYTSEKFLLPIRLGLLNANGEQDLMVFILAEDRYEAANRKNAFIPTNLSVSHQRKDDFATWYDNMFKRQVRGSKAGAVVTEYVWPTAIKCDPCPPGAVMLGNQNIQELGGEFMGSKINPQKMVLTRLHTRYGVAGGTSDIVFQKAHPVVGGREHRSGGKLEQGAKKADRNNFQARYAIRFKWKGKIACEDPRRGIWTHSVATSPFFGRPIRRRPIGRGKKPSR